MTPEDLNISTEYEGLPVTVISDGSINYENLNNLKLDKQWLLNEHKKFNNNNQKEVFFACLDTQGNLFFQIKNKSKGDNNESS